MKWLNWVSVVTVFIFDELANVYKPYLAYDVVWVQKNLRVLDGQSALAVAQTTTIRLLIDDDYRIKTNDYIFKGNLGISDLTPDEIIGLYDKYRDNAVIVKAVKYNVINSDIDHIKIEGV